MRGDTNPAGTRRTLKLAALAADTRAMLAAGAAAVLVAAFTGALDSPLLVFTALWLASVATTPLRSRWPALASASIAVLFSVELLTGGWSVLHVAAALGLLAVAVLPATYLARRDARVADRLARLDQILDESTRSPLPAAEAPALRRLRELETALEDVRSRLGAARAVLWDVDEDVAVMRIQAGARAGPPEVPLQGNPLGWLFEEGGPLTFDAVPRVSARDTRVVAFRLARVERRGTLLTLEFPKGAPLLSADAVRPALGSFEALLELHDERLRAEESRTRVAFMLDALRRIPGSLEPQAFGDALARDAARLADATGGVLALWGDDAGRILAVAGLDGGPAAGSGFEPAESQLAMAARAGASLVRERIDSRARTIPWTAPGELWARRPRAFVAIPLHGSGGVTGVLAVWSAERATFDAEAIALLETLAPFAAQQLERALEFGRVRETADRDALTGLANRRVFQRELANEAARYDRYHRSIGLAALDVDHFKSVNDRFGHEAGDMVLRYVASTLENAVRDSDVAARIGGEEFAVLLPETSLRATTEAAERLRRDVEALDLSWQGAPIPVRVSIGVSACPECVPVPTDLLRSADAALYRAKRGGRNRVATATTAG